MNNLNTMFNGSLRVRNSYKSGGDPLERWKINMINLAIRHQAEAKAGQQALRRSWHERQLNGSYIATIRLNHRMIVIGGRNTWNMADLDEVVKFYDFVIDKLKTDEFDLSILNSAINTKSMKQEAMSVLKARFPDSPLLKEFEKGDTNPTVAEKSQLSATDQEV